MHEIALMSEILKIVETDAKGKKIRLVQEIELVVGDLSNVMPDALRMAFDLFKYQGIEFLDKDAKLRIVREKAKAQCIICGLDYFPEEKIAFCPKCNFPSGKLLNGETLKVNSYKGSA